MIVVDINGIKATRIINIYRTFSPANGVSCRNSFITQLEIIAHAWIPGTIKVGDFNLDWNKRFDTYYNNKHYFEDMDRITGTLELLQLVEEPTWRRVVNGVVRESVLDHVYVNGISTASNLKYTWPVFGDHAAVIFDVGCSKMKRSEVVSRTGEAAVLNSSLPGFQQLTGTSNRTWYKITGMSKKIS